MSDSRFRKMAEADIASHGYGVLLDPDYAGIISKTQIVRHSASRADYAWLDSKGRVVASCEKANPDDPALPLIGKVESVNRRASYQKAYGQKRKRYEMGLTHHDQDIIDWLDAQDNVQGYIKGLIRRDMAERAGNPAESEGRADG